MGAHSSAGGVIRDPNRLPIWNLLPMCEGEPEPGHMLTFACPCLPLVTWEGDEMEIVHFPLYPGCEPDMLMSVDDDD